MPVGFIQTFKDYSSRTFILNFLSFLFALGFLAYTVVITIILQYMWYVFLVIYYSIVLAMRFAVLYIADKNRHLPQAEKYPFYLKLYKIYGILFIFLFAVFASMLFTEFRVYRSHRLTVPLIIFSSYAIIKFALALHNYFKARKVRHVLVQILRNLSVLDALMTVFIMQTFLASYLLGKNTANIAFIHRFIEIIGGAVMGIITVILGIAMIVESVKRQRELKQAEAEAKQTTIAKLPILKDKTLNEEKE